MKKNFKNKMVAILAVIAMLVAMAGCAATNDSFVNESSTEETYVETTEVEMVSEETETEAVETETEAETEETTEEESEEIETTEESVVEDETEDEKNTEATSNAEVNQNDKETETTKVVEEKPVHTHSWDGGTVTQAATCTNNGVKTYKCSCGETKTEAIGATGHNWVAQTTVVHHDAEGMFQQVKTGDRKVVICDCGEKFYDNETFQAHNSSTIHGGTITTEPIYETKWVETSAAWDETVTTGYICSLCGTSK
jgi:acetone carboxylase gamma subunit